MWRPYIEYMEFEDICNKYSYYENVNAYTGNGFLYVTPLEGQAYIPFLLHSHVTDGMPSTNLGAAVIEQCLKLNMDNPPFILITEGKFGLSNFISSQVFLNHCKCVNTIIGANGNKAFCYEHFDDIPEELREALLPWWSRTKTSHSIPIMSLSSAYDIPCVLIHPNHITGQQSTYDNKSFDHAVEHVNKILYEPLPSFSSYTFTRPSLQQGEEGTKWFVPRPCACCGKRRGTKFFGRIHAYLCEKCVQRIRRVGPINHITFVQAMHTLNTQRLLTRRANAYKHHKLCPVCGESGIVWSTHAHMDTVGTCMRCGTPYCTDNWQRFYFYYSYMVYEYVNRKILSMKPLDGHPTVSKCYVCGTLSANATPIMIGDRVFHYCDTCDKVMNEE